MKKIFLLILSLTFSNYVNFEILTYDNPFPSNLIIHSMGEGTHFMAILDSNVSPKWYINSNNYGFDFKANGNKLTYFNKDFLEWTILDEYMIERHHAVKYHGRSNRHGNR